MTSNSSSSQIRTLWDRLSRLPRGRSLFSFALSRMAPYSGSIRPHVLEIGRGFARVAMDDRRAVRNHLKSVHAIALMNLGELTTGLALHYELRGHAQAILTGLSIEYTKKARGRLVAEASTATPEGSEREEIEIEAVIRDSEGDVVARASARWLVGPRAPDSSPS